MQLLAHSASERQEDSRTTKRPIFRANRRASIDQKCSFKATSVCIALAGNLQLPGAKCSGLELPLSLAWRRGRGTCPGLRPTAERAASAGAGMDAGPGTCRFCSLPLRVPSTGSCRLGRRTPQSLLYIVLL